MSKTTVRRSDNHLFSQVPQAEIQRSRFDRSHGHKTTFDAGYLIPILLDEALPGDTFNVRMATLCRLATPLCPIMDNVYLDSHFFAVPLRLIWDNFQKFNGEQRNPGDSTDYIVPQMTSPAGGYLNGSIHDYMGLPTLVAGVEHSSLFHRAYNLIWNEWFRDENLQNSLPVPTGDGPDVPTDYTLQKRGKRHDYFTSCLPWPQKGPAVNLPLGLSAPVGNAPSSLNTNTGNPTIWRQVAGGAVASQGLLGTHASGGTAAVAGSGQINSLYASNLYADLSQATAATINQLRQAFQIQKIYERDARGGTRYTEIIRSHFGVISPDARLQRPEYLGGGSQIFMVAPVPQTSSADATSPQGNLAAYGVSTSSDHRFVKSFTEHCIIIGLVSVRADLSYQQGLNRMFSRKTRWDFYWPSLAHIGEQAVLNKEIYSTGVDAQDDAVFGYQERYAEYRYKPSLITGKMRSNDPQSLDIWHLAQDFASLPVLGSTFIQENPPIKRVSAVPTEPDVIFDGYFNMVCARPMPVYSVPGLIDHF